MGLKQLSIVDFGPGELTSERGMISCEGASLQKPGPNKNHAQLQPQMSMQLPLLPHQQGASFSSGCMCVTKSHNNGSKLPPHPNTLPPWNHIQNDRLLV